MSLGTNLVLELGKLADNNSMLLGAKKWGDNSCAVLIYMIPDKPEENPVRYYSLALRTNEIVVSFLLRRERGESIFSRITGVDIPDEASISVAQFVDDIMNVKDWAAEEIKALDSESGTKPVVNLDQQTEQHRLPHDPKV